jgi:Ca2+-dependent lipid-binding protein
VLVGPGELNADERRVQLWDSDRLTVDDDLGRIEVDLKELMKSRRSNGKMWDRQDGFMAMEADEKMPGTLDWSVGYFAKTKIQPEQLERQTEEPEVENFEQLEDKLSREAEQKLREASDRDVSEEIEKQKLKILKLGRFVVAPSGHMIT